MFYLVTKIHVPMFQRVTLVQVATDGVLRVRVYLRPGGVMKTQIA